MARKNYSEEFRRQAVDLYESTPGPRSAVSLRTWALSVPCASLKWPHLEG